MCDSSENKEVRDHRKIGRDQEIFGFDSKLGSGMPIWLKNGFTLKQIIISYVNGIQRENGVTMVSTPELGRRELYETSGHWDHYRENMFPPMKIDEEGEYILRPMTCPHHTILFQQRRWRINQMPVAFGENSRLYRYEYSGGLFGLERTRCMELIDTHIFCARDQIIESLERSWNIIEKVKRAFGIEYDSIILALRSKEKAKFFDDDDLWNNSQSILRTFLSEKGIKFQENEGDAAFYGPKIDFQIKTKNQKIITISTIQLDFVLPGKFQLKYLNGEDREETPVMVHLGIIGTLERFISYLLERDDGWLPFWLSPVQISLIPINPEKHMAAAEKICEIYGRMNLRVEIKGKNKSLGKRLAEVIQERSYGYMVIGDREAEEIEAKAFDPVEKSLSNWEREMAGVYRSRNKEEKISIAEERYPEGHPDFLRWSSFGE